MKIIRSAFLLMSLVFFVDGSYAQKNLFNTFLNKFKKADTISKANKQPKIKPEVNQVDTNKKATISVNDKFKALRKSLINDWNRAFINFKENNVYLYAGMGMSKQTIDIQSYSSNFNYNLLNLDKSSFKPGYFVGARVDGTYKGKFPYTFGIGLQKLSTGTQYTNSISLSPILGSYSTFKADDQFFVMNTFAHYRKLIPYKNNGNKKFYFILGPNIDTRLSSQSFDNQIKYNYRRFLLRGDIGIEYDNNGYYTVFVHYKHALSSFTKAPIQTNLNSIEIGMQINASDIF